MKYTASSPRRALTRGLRFCIFLSLCSFFGKCVEKLPNPPAAARTPDVVLFSRNWEAKIGFPDSFTPTIVRLEDTSLLASVPCSNGVLHSLSSDNGRTWTEPTLVNLCGRPLYLTKQWKGVFWYISSEQTVDGGQFYVHSRSKVGSNAASPVRDTDWGSFAWVASAFDSAGRIYAVWGDSREGNSDVYFSCSTNAGATWLPNIRVNDDQTGQEQLDPTIACSPSGTLCVLWSDNRNPHTLFDIFCSTSTDGGRTWSRNIKLNDDTTRTWQSCPSVVHDGKNFAVSWMDYREMSSIGESRSSVYFARSRDDGRTWSRNVRISENTLGNSTYPTLSALGSESLACLWMNSEQNILRDVFYAHSVDGGASWSSPVKVNDDTTQADHYHRSIGWLGTDRGGESVVGWLDIRTGRRRAYMAATRIADGSAPNVNKKLSRAPNIPVLQPLVYQKTRPLLRDSFATNPSPRWTVHSGTWVWKDRLYVGYGALHNFTTTGNSSWTDYEFTGRFKLDPIEHKASYVYLRVTNERPLRYFRITNLFKAGIRAEYFDGEKFSSLAEVLYPIGKDRWYRFKAVIKKNTLNYFIEDTLRIVSQQMGHLREGRVGIGSQSVPVYFSTIAVDEVQ